MTAPVQASPGPDSFTLQDWTKILHTAAQIPQTHSRYAEARQVMREALNRIGGMQEQQNQADQAALAPGKFASGVEGFGTGASLGLLGQNSPIPPQLQNALLQGATMGAFSGEPNQPLIDPQFLAAARQAHPIATGAGDLAGTATLGGIAGPLVAGLSPAAGGAVLSGGLGAARGAVEGGEGNRGAGAAVGGILGAVTGGVGGKVVGKIAPALGRVATNLLGKAGRVADEEIIGNMSAGAMRRALRRQGFAPETIERLISSARAQIRAQAAEATAVKPQVPGTMGPLKSRLTPIPGTEGRGFSAVGPAMPKAPTGPGAADMQPTIPQIRDRLAVMARPPGKGVPSDPAAFSEDLLKVHRTLLDLQQRLGRSLTAGEREQVLTKLLGATGPARTAANAFGSNQAIRP